MTDAPLVNFACNPSGRMAFTRCDWSPASTAPAELIFALTPYLQLEWTWRSRAMRNENAPCAARCIYPCHLQKCAAAKQGIAE